MEEPFNIRQFVAWVDEFYTTTDENRRHELDTALCRFRTEFGCQETISSCVSIINSPNISAHARYFAAMSLYDIIRGRSEECISNMEILESLKVFLIDSLTNGAHIQTQSITNKLSSTLALLALYCIPDVWSEPIADLTSLWAATPELLLRVLSEMAAEFQHVKVPLTQRSLLKAELHKMTQDLIKIIGTVLSAGDATPSTRQAAIECVEQWLRLPGASLESWANVLDVVFASVADDCAALTNLFNILSDNEDIENLTQLIINICEYISTTCSQKVAEELRGDSCSEEVRALVASICGFLMKAVPTLAQNFLQASDPRLIDILSFLQAIGNWEGRFPIDERVSDLAIDFWTLLRVELNEGLPSSPKNDPNLMATVRRMYAQCLHCAVFKHMYPPWREFASYSAEDKELFDSYRVSREEIPFNAYSLVGESTLKFLNVELEGAIAGNDVNKCECVLHLWAAVSELLSEKAYEEILHCIQLLTSPSLAEVDPNDGDQQRRGNTLMSLLLQLAHLIQDHDKVVELELAIIPLILTHLERLSDPENALFALFTYVHDRSESLNVIGSTISERCYNFFMDESHPEQQRLEALKCIGHVLTKRTPKEAMEIIGHILDVHVRNDDKCEGLSDQQIMTIYSFKIKIFSALFESLRLKNQDEASLSEEPTIVLAVKEALPVFETIVEQPQSGPLVADVLMAMRSAISALPKNYLPAVFPFLARLLHTTLLSSPQAAVELAKSTVLLCGLLPGTELCDAICDWFSMFEANSTNPDIEYWLALIYAIVKKNWKTLRAHKDRSIPAIRSAINLAAYAVFNSHSPMVMKDASNVLASIATQTTADDDGEVRSLLASHGNELVKGIFQRIQTFLTRPIVESLAEVLFFFMQQFPSETRAVLNDEPYGDSQLVTAMFREIKNLRTFKQTVVRFNLAATKDLTL
ncbi:unnamed protein product [Caenorhabditis auriculariae]|uniref:Exportin-1/Importin-beta-like domain-containing protein n=1 Tax=Caenorhabditis auriculariae TaxID=2777116 RepID=A0A8S1H064_9PELO|nr:unnamed protein product [Caenorhabditis auriculariae]